VSGNDGREGERRKRGKCQVCGREVQVLRDGTSRPHKRRKNARDIYADYCGGSGFRNARWPQGQLLRHHGGDVWEIVAPSLIADEQVRRGRGTFPMADDYFLRCLAGREQDREMRAHSEYMHRDGWTAIADAPSLAESESAA
jgi:hypothetical protein